MILSVLESVL